MQNLQHKAKQNRWKANNHFQLIRAAVPKIRSVVSYREEGGWSTAIGWGDYPWGQKKKKKKEIGQKETQISVLEKQESGKVNGNY